MSDTSNATGLDAGANATKRNLPARIDISLLLANAVQNISKAQAKVSADQKALGENIAKVRRARGIKQEQLAQIIGVHRITLSAWENGRGAPDDPALKKISEALGLMPGTEPFTPTPKAFPGFKREKQFREGENLAITHNRDMGKRIRERRAFFRFTQQQAAEVIGVPKKTYVMWENGVVPDAGNLAKLARAFKQSAECFMYGHSATGTINSALSNLTLSSIETAFMVNDLSEAGHARVKTFIRDLKEEVRNSGGRNKETSSP